MQRLRPLSLPFCIVRQKSVRALKTTTGEESKQLARNQTWPLAEALANKIENYATTSLDDTLAEDAK